MTGPVLPLLLILTCAGGALLGAGSAQALALPDPAAAKAADKCQKTITKSGAKFASKTLKSLGKCYDAVFKCVQTKPGDQKCLDKALAKCVKESATVAKERTKLTDTIVKKCPTDPTDLTAALGLGFEALATTCNDDFGVPLTDVASIAACIREQHECQAEEAFNVEMPRAGGFADALAIPVRAGTCLRDLAGTGGDVGDPTLGKALDKCQKEAKKAGAKFVASKLKTLEKCAGGLFKCVQTKPGDQKCLDKAEAKCGKELGAKVAKAVAKLEASLVKKCAAAIYDDMRQDEGMHVDGLASRCVAVGVADLGTDGDYRRCVVRQLTCLAEDMARFQAPRADALLQSVGHDLRSPFCAGAGQVVVSVTKQGAGTGTVTSTPPGIACGDSCVASFDVGQPVDLEARTENGADSYFQVWGGACESADAFHDCQLTPNTPQVVDAWFGAQTHNLVFSTEERFSITLGVTDPNDPTAPYDTACNQLATDAGINNLAGNGFTAWLSTSAETAPVRLGAARGFVRMDGAPFADELAELLGQNEIFNAVEFDQEGEPNLNANLPMTGTSPIGLKGSNCDDFMSDTTGIFLFGSAFSGPFSWTAEGGFACSVVSEASLYCFGNDKAAALVPEVSGGKLIYATDTFYLVGTIPDDKCTAEKPAGAGTVKALLATTATPAATHLADGVTYVRPDGQVVGTKAEIVAAANAFDTSTRLRSGIWQTGDGTYASGSVFAGSADITATGTLADTCNDWMDSGAVDSAVAGSMSDTTTAFWGDFTLACDGTDRRILCVEQ